jgi:hypothetical protein
MKISSSNLHACDYILAPFNFSDIKFKAEDVFNLDYSDRIETTKLFENRSVIGFYNKGEFTIYEHRNIFEENKKSIENLWNLQRYKQYYMIFGSTSSRNIVTFDYVKKYMSKIFNDKEYEIFSWNDYICEGKSHVSGENKIMITVIDI